ncbi:hypothetical protein [Kordia sp.]
MKKRSIEEIKNEESIQVVHQTKLIKGGSMAGMTSETEVVE